MNTNRFPLILKCLNTLDLLGVCIVLLIAFVFQIALNELPCPLCLLQRLGVLAIGFGFLLNIHYQVKPAHYGLTLLAALFTAFVAARQMALHMAPGTGSYGAPFLGLHLYTWVCIFAVGCLLYTTIMLCFPGQYMNTIPTPVWLKRLSHFVFIFYFAVCAANVISIYLECGLHECPDNPVAYDMGAA